MWRRLIFSFIIVLFADLAIAQRQFRQNEERLYDPPAPLHVGAALFTTDRPGIYRVDVNVQFVRNLLVFTKSDLTLPAADTFVAAYDLFIEVKDNKGLTLGDKLLSGQLHQESAESLNAPRRYLQRSASFLIHGAGARTVKAELTDRESKRSLSSFTTLEVDSSSNKQLLGALLFQSYPDTTKEAEVQSLGSSIPIGSGAIAYFELIGNRSPDSIDFAYEIALVASNEREDTDRRPLFADTLTSAELHSTTLLEVHSDENGNRYRAVTASDEMKLPCWIPLPTDTLSVGRYEMTVRVLGTMPAVQQRFLFSISWNDLPFTLTDFNLALAPLKYIADESEIKLIRNSPAGDRKSTLERFWKHKDPTPRTAFNELMAEFYRRADYALRNFATLRQPDGIATERGKTYILYGPPSSIERNLQPSGPAQEIWYYASLKKKLIFVDERHNGVYKLAATIDS